MRPIAAVAGLGERVGPERLELLRRDQLIDRGGNALVVEEFEVVHDLAALVAEVALVLETGRTGHGSENLPAAPEPPGDRPAIGGSGHAPRAPPSGAIWELGSVDCWTIGEWKLGG